MRFLYAPLQTSFVGEFDSQKNFNGTIFNKGSAGFDGGISAIKQQSDGKVIYAGAFTSYNGIKANGLLRLNTDTTLDTSFVSNIGTEVIGGAISVIDVLPNGKILLGGSDMGKFNGVSRNRFAVLNANGTLDATINPSFYDGTVSSIYVYPDSGSFILGGSIRINTPYIQSLACYYTCRFLSNGTLDTTWQAQGQSAYIRDARFIKKDDYGNFLIGGQPADSGGRALIRVIGDGRVDTSFRYELNSDTTNAIEILSDNTYLVAQTKSNGLYKQVEHIFADGSLDYLFLGSKSMAGATSMVKLPNDKIVVTGSFVGGIMQLNSDGTEDTSFDYRGNGLNGSGKVTIINDKLVVYGFFSAINDSPAYFISYLLNNSCMPGYINYK